MKCPYQTRVIHKPAEFEVTDVCKNFAEDITIFGDCIKTECPFYYVAWNDIARIEKCRKAESES